MRETVVDSGTPGDSRRRDLLILVVEDEVIIAMDLRRRLEEHGFRVLGPAPTVAVALDLLEKAAPDLALLDVNLRGQMVTPVADRLQARGVPFILASAYDDASLPAPVLVGAPHVGKPVNMRRLLALMATLVP